jgi:RNA polymerase sigma-70 factor (ECF subfamily)
MTDREFLRLALAHLPRLLRFARRLCGDPDRAEDLVQETYIRALKVRRHLRDQGALLPWLLRVLHTRYLDETRTETRRLELLAAGPPALPPATADLERELLEGTLSAEVEAALLALPEDQRAAILLADVEGLSYEEIGQVLGCPVGTVRSRIARARARLFEALSATAHARRSHRGRSSP